MNKDELAKKKKEFEDMFEPQDLHPDLKPYIHKIGTLGDCLRHPLVYCVPYFPIQNKQLNKQYEFKRKAIARNIEEGKWINYIFLHERPYRLQAFVECVTQGLTGNDYWKALGGIWVDSENIHQNISTWGIMLSGQNLGDGPHAMMEPEEKAFYDALPPIIRVFRGHDKKHTGGLSWTMSYSKAHMFAHRFRPLQPTISSGLVAKEDILSVFLGRNEVEVVARPTRIKERHTFELPTYLAANDKLSGMANTLKEGFALDNNSVHGPLHWRKVYGNAMQIMSRMPDTKISPLFITLFAMLHDAFRENEVNDPDHGKRAAAWAMRHRNEILLGDELFDELYFALQHHNGGSTTSHDHAAVCWDADRLDLIRVGILPKADMLSTEAAKGLIGIV